VVLPEPPPPQAERHSAVSRTASGPFNDIPDFLDHAVFVDTHVSVSLAACRTKRKLHNLDRVKGGVPFRFRRESPIAFVNEAKL
jgi:hypothetical protein